jgi:hypothetical protein
MKILFLLLVSFISLNAKSDWNDGLCPGDDCEQPEPTTALAIFPLPVQIGFDGTTKFAWMPEEEGNGPELSWYISPMLYMTFDKGKILVNLAQHSMNKAITLEGANQKTGYLVLEKMGFEIGVGAGVFFEPVNNLSFGVGLFPTGGSMLYSQRFANNLEEAEHLPKMKFPKDSKSLDSWNDNDYLIYNRSGGISFFASAGYTVAQVGIGYSAVGNWRVFLKKVSKNKIMATVSKIDLKSFNMELGATVTNLTLNKFNAFDKSLAYEFDLESKSGQQGFDEFLSGNFKFTRRLAKKGSVEGIEHLSQSNSQSTGRIMGVMVGFPIIGSLQLEKGIVQSFSDVHSLGEDKKVENTMAVYSRSVETSGLASKGMKNVVLFSASHQKIMEHEKKDSSTFTTANFKWLFSEEKTQIKHLESRLLELKRITGLWDKFEFNFPPEKKLDYTQFEFDTMISSDGTQALVSENLDQNSVSEVQENIKKYFEHETPTKLCRFFKQIYTCKAHLLKVSAKAINKMVRKVSEMKHWKKAKDWKSFTKAYAELGKEALTNQFTFRAFLEMIGKENFKMEFKVSGEKLSTLHLDQLENEPAFQ